MSLENFLLVKVLAAVDQGFVQCDSAMRTNRMSSAPSRPLHPGVSKHTLHPSCGCMPGKECFQCWNQTRSEMLSNNSKSCFNAILHTRIVNDQDVCAAAASHHNGKGWPKQLSKQEGPSKNKEERRAHKMMTDKMNKAQCLQWVDSKVVNAVTSLLSAEMSHVFRQKGNKKEKCSCPMAVQQHQTNMLGVGKGDQAWSHGGGFSRKAHFKKGTRKHTWQCWIACGPMHQLSGMTARPMFL
jgi:hypothetical protein